MNGDARERQDGQAAVQGHSNGGRGGRPMERLTADPASTSVPWRGFWRSTVPMLLHVGSSTLATCPTVRPAAASTWPAWARRSFRTSGTRTEGWQPPTRAKRVFQEPLELKYCWAITAQAPPGTCGSTETDEKSPNRVWLVILPAA